MQWFKMRPSKYLSEKAQNFSQALSFFIDRSGKHSLIDKRLVFLAQIDFWDWEMDTLIFSFDNFKERSQAWAKGSKHIKESLLRLGIPFKHNMLERLSLWDQNRVFAPIKELNVCIDQWNRLLALCEETLLMDPALVEKFGMSSEPNLNKYRKERREEEDGIDSD